MKQRTALKNILRLQSGIAHIGLIVFGVAILVIVGLSLNSSGFFDSFFYSMGAIGPPPSDTEARKEWFSENFMSMDTKIYLLDEKLPTWEELDRLNENLPDRSYPDYIKAIQTYNPTPNLVEVLYFGDELADLGVNTQFIHAFYWLQNGELKLMYTGYDDAKKLSQDEAKRAIVHNILLARQQGLAVVLFPDYHHLEDGGMVRHGISDDLEERLEEIALDLAEIAEKYKVEYFVPVNQIEMILDSNNYSREEAVKRTNAFYSNVVPKIRQKYSGKVMYKMGGFGDWSNYDDISLEGADIFGFTGCYNSRGNDIDFVTRDIKFSAEQANKMSSKYNIPWFNAEFVISTDESSRYSGEIGSPIEDYYSAGLAAFDEYADNASGFTVHSLFTTGKVYETPAWPLIKDFFASK